MTDSLQLELDQLVGGDLSNDQIRQLVSRLEEEPDGWKRCATTYLEAQTWQRHFRGITTETSNELPPPRVAVHASGGKTRVLATICLMAAMLLLGFGLSWGWQMVHPTDRDPARLAGNEPKAPAEQHANPETGKKLDLVAVVSITAEGLPQSDIPIMSDGKSNLVALDGATELTEYELSRWEREGYRVEQHRKVIDVRLADGNRFRFPVDWVQYHYVGHRLY